MKTACPERFAAKGMNRTRYGQPPAVMKEQPKAPMIQEMQTAEQGPAVPVGGAEDMETCGCQIPRVNGLTAVSRSARRAAKTAQTGHPAPEQPEQPIATGKASGGIGHRTAGVLRMAAAQ